MLHYTLVILLIILIIVLQIRSYSRTASKIKEYIDIFPSAPGDYIVDEIEIDDSETLGDDEPVNEDLFNEDYTPTRDKDDSERISQLRVNSKSHVMNSIITAINSYLKKNRGAASDFHLIKDVVERYCGAIDDEITTQQPIPLYLGLMGTMIGIIVGIGSIAFSGGLEGSTLMDHITELMTCVAIAMSASFVGVLCTTLIAYKSKNANSKVEESKNNFYSWIQTELLPVLSGDAANAIFLLQQNLMSFNQTFKSNVSGLDTALSKISSASQEQISLIELIQDIDIKRVAQANVQVLKELKDCTGEIKVFNQYLHSVGNYLATVNSLNDNINEHLNRTAAIEKMGAFFEKEISQVSEREQYINQVVVNVDNILKKSFEELSEGTQKALVELKAQSVSEYAQVTATFDKQKELFQKHLDTERDQMIDIIEKRQNEFNQYLDSQKEKLDEKASVLPTLTEELKSLGETKNFMLELVKTTTEQNSKLERLINVIQHNNASVQQMPFDDNPNKVVVSKPGLLDQVVRYCIMICAIFIMIAVGLYIYDFIDARNHDFSTPVNNENVYQVQQFDPNIELNESIVDTVDTNTVLVQQDSLKFSNLGKLTSEPQDD